MDKEPLPVATGPSPRVDALVAGKNAAWANTDPLVALARTLEVEGNNLERVREAENRSAGEQVAQLFSSIQRLQALLRDARELSPKELRQRIDAALDHFRPIPEGYVLVPLEPTFEMAKAGRFAWEDPPFPERYRAMLAAAPKP